MTPALIRSNPRGWLVVLVAFTALSFSFSSRATLGVMIPGWEQEFGWTRKFLSSGGAVMLVVMAMVSPVAGSLIDRFGPRWLFAIGLGTFGGTMILTGGAMTEPWQFMVIFCILGGIGYTLVGLPLTSTAIARLFVAHRGLATSITSSGVGVGQLLLVPLFAAGVAAAGWRWSYVAFGIGSIALGIVAFRLLGNGRGAGGHVAAARETMDTLPVRMALLARAPTFWLLIGAYTICGFTTAGIVKVHLLPYAVACGYPLVQSATAYGVMAGFNVVGMLLSGWLTDRINRPVLLGSVYFLRALAFILLIYIGADIRLLFLFAVIFGTLDFATVPPTAGIVATHLGVRTMGFTMGVLFAGHSVGAAAGAFLGGWIYDLYARYDGVWLIGLAVALAAAVLSWSIREIPRTDHGRAAAATA